MYARLPSWVTSGSADRSWRCMAGFTDCMTAGCVIWTSPSDRSSRSPPPKGRSRRSWLDCCGLPRFQAFLEGVSLIVAFAGLQRVRSFSTTKDFAACCVADTPLLLRFVLIPFAWFAALSGIQAVTGLFAGCAVTRPISDVALGAARHISVTNFQRRSPRWMAVRRLFWFPYQFPPSFLFGWWCVTSCIQVFCKVFPSGQWCPAYRPPPPNPVAWFLP